jgi:AbrB family looped-hinge helix DNA binding protein
MPRSPAHAIFDSIVPASTLQIEVELGAQGRLVVPAAIRKMLGFEPGEPLLARVEEGRLIIEKAESVERRVRARFDKVKGRSLADELIAERREEARREEDG